MPNETPQAINWALQQTADVEGIVVNVTKETSAELVDKVREYFNTNKITYSTFSFDDLKPFFN